MTTADIELLVQALRRLVAPFLEQGTPILFFSRNEDGTRYYAGITPAALDSTTGQPPKHQCQRRGVELNNEAAVRSILTDLTDPTDETFARAALAQTPWIAAVLRLPERRIVASVRSGNKIRTIRYRWEQKDATIVPPKNWTDAVLGECQFQDESSQPTNVVDVFRQAKGGRRR